MCIRDRPFAAKGPLALAEPGSAAQMRVTKAAMPWSAECLKLRELKQAMAAFNRDQRQGRYRGRYAESCMHWRSMMWDYGEVAAEIAARPNPTWQDACELAEIAWHMAQKERTEGNWAGKMTGRLSTVVDGFDDPHDYWRRKVHVALIETILKLGGGERFDPQVAFDPD